MVLLSSLTPSVIALTDASIVQQLIYTTCFDSYDSTKKKKYEILMIMLSSLIKV